MKKVVVGLSGGVDSSVAAYLLQQAGYEVIGIFMRNWNDASATLEDECPWVEDSTDAMLVAESLGIPFQVIDFSTAYKARIVDYMFAEYEAGRTPNPDVLCNREIKFDLFLKIALQLGADYVATGHYCQKNTLKNTDGTTYQLLAGADKNKDQSYFLCQLSQYQLSKALFPIGHLQKKEVRAIATTQGFITADKKDSQGLCFIGHIRLPDFLQQQLKPKKGKIIEIPINHPIYEQLKNNLETQAKPYIYKPEDGKIVGEHMGAHFFTIGQRKGLAIGGTPEPLFVIATDTNTNIVYVGQGHQHPGLWRKALYIKSEKAHWLRPDLKINTTENLLVESRIRYRQPLIKSKLYHTNNGYYLEFENTVEAITPGQFAACYLHNELIFSGVIES